MVRDHPWTAGGRRFFESIQTGTVVEFTGETDFLTKSTPSLPTHGGGPWVGKLGLKNHQSLVAHSCVLM